MDTHHSIPPDSDPGPWNDPNPSEFEQTWEEDLRPQQLDDFVGQASLRENLSILIQAAKLRTVPLEHVLLTGPPGLGKTSMARLLANEMGVEIRQTSGPVLEKAGDLAGLLTSLPPGGILFVDEIHRLNRTIEEYLYPAMEDFRLDILLDRGPSARSVQLRLEPFTLVGATTRSGLLTSPLRARFGMVGRVEFYKEQDLIHIVMRSARLLRVEIEAEAVGEIARRSRGTPRIANRILRRMRDYALVKGDGVITHEMCRAGLELLEIDERGLDPMDRRLLRSIVETFDGGPVGLSTLAATVGEEPDTLEEVHEPYLVMQGFVQRTRLGRIATRATYELLGRAAPRKSSADPEQETFL